MSKTIFAPATHPGKSGVAIIRISGPSSKSVFNILTEIKNPYPRRAIFTKLLTPQTKEIIDEAIIIWFPCPNSFTAEDVIELHIHGSVAIINILMTILAEIDDFRVAMPGEFARRAFLNGKMDLTEAEGLADLIEAETSLQHKQAMRQMRGELADLYDSWRKKIIKFLAYLEAYIDFPDEDIPENLINKIMSEKSNLITEITNHLDDQFIGEKLRQGLCISIIGKPNAGKSSLLNLLAKRQVAIVSNIPGTTRDVLEVHLEIAGVPVTIADTAGIRESEDEIEKEGIRRALEQAKISDFSIIMNSATDLENILESSKNDIIILNKIDLVDINLLPKEINGQKPIYISLKNQTGIELFLTSLEDKIKTIFTPSANPMITRARYRNHLKKVVENLELFDINKPLELAAEDLRLAAREIGHITGIIEIDTILDEIFMNFCIGK